MQEGDNKIRREILKWLYEQFEESPNRKLRGEAFVDDLTNSFDKEDLVYNVDRMDGDTLSNEGALGKHISLIRISPEGIEKLQSQGHETFLDTDERYNILEKLYKADRENPGYAYVSRDDIVDELGIDESLLDQNIWYLKEKRLVETRGGGGSYFYRSASITDSGRKRYEQYREDGTEIPRTSGRLSLRQASIGPNESGKAENLFRDFVELSTDEVIIIDRYAREGLYDLLNHVPSGVDIKVITTDRVTGQAYTQKVNQFRKQHTDIEVKYLSDNNWEFHDRYIIRDREDSWAWGHSFHDAGDTQHTASELKPINREQIINQFEESWKNGTKIQ